MDFTLIPEHIIVLRCKKQKAGKMILYGYKYSATGIFGYEYYDSGNQICTIGNLVIPNTPTFMFGWKLSWQTGFDRDITIVPGQRLPIINQESKEKEAEIITESFKTYRLSCKAEMVTVVEETGRLVFMNDGIQIAVCRRAGLNEAPSIELYGEVVEARYAVELDSNISKELKLLILAFPSLGLGIPSRYCFAL